MSTHQTMMRCKACGKQTVHIQERANHVLHLLLTLLSLGVWIPIWFLCSLSGPPRCTSCGRKKGIFG